MYWSSLKLHGELNTAVPCEPNGALGLTICGVGIAYAPLGNL